MLKTNYSLSFTSGGILHPESMTIIHHYTKSYDWVQAKEAVGYANSTKIDPTALTEEEKAVVKEFKWWPIHELETTTEFVVPPSMITHIKPIMNGQIPHSPIQIDLSDAPAKALDIYF